MGDVEGGAREDLWGTRLAWIDGQLSWWGLQPDRALQSKIEKHNRLAHKGHTSYHMAMNQFGDLLHHEFTALMNGYQSRSKFNYTGTDVLQRGAQYLPPLPTLPLILSASKYFR